MIEYEFRRISARSVAEAIEFALAIPTNWDDDYRKELRHVASVLRKLDNGEQQWAVSDGSIKWSHRLDILGFIRSVDDRTFTVEAVENLREDEYPSNHKSVLFVNDRDRT